MKCLTRYLTLFTFLAMAGPSACAHAAQFKMHVSGATSSGKLPQRFAYDKQGCHGDNQRPDVSWSHAPAATRSFAVSVFDRDAHFWHWMVVDLDAKTHSLRGNQHLPTSAHALRNGYGHAGWGGPCPPPGAAHHYVFTVYALDVAHLSLPSSADAAHAAKSVHKHVLKKAHVTVTYGR